MECRYHNRRLPTILTFRNFRELSMSKPLDDYYRSDASRTTVSRRHLLRLTTDERRTYQKWMRAIFIVYGTVATIIVTLSMTIGPTERASNGKSEIYSSLVLPTGKSR